MDHPGGHGHGRDPCGSQQGINFVFGKQIHDLGQDDPCHGTHHKGGQAQAENKDHLGPQEIVRIHGGPHGHPPRKMVTMFISSFWAAS